MANVVVVGGGFAGLSAAARIAKLRHDVTLLESGERLGGRLNGYTVDGQTWQLQLDTVTLPGVFRDLFRKSGRTLDRVLEFTKTDGRRHLFNDGTVLDLPLGNRGDQHEAIVDVFGEDTWSPWIDQFSEQWEILRTVALNQIFEGRPVIDRSVRKALRPRRTVKALDKDFADERLAKIVLDPVRLAGHDWRITPGFVAIAHYLERSFGRWRFEGGLPALAAALEHRLEERKVTVVLGEAAHSVVREGNQVTGVVTDKRTVPADAVVWTAPTSPSPLPLPRGLQIIPASRTLVTLSADAPAMPHELLVHVNPPIRLWTANGSQWTIEHRSGEDPLNALVRAGLDLRPFVTQRIDLSPSDLVAMGHWGWTWNTWTSAFDLPGIAPSGGLYFAGAGAHPGGTLEAIGMATAAIAEDLRP
ncbi:phytoene desaturase family protein [Aeromicrobium sp. P5_D10]